VNEECRIEYGIVITGNEGDGVGKVAVLRMDRQSKR
jgi:hypothetical protein